MIHKSSILYVLLFILVLDVSGIALKSNKHKSTVSKSAKESAATTAEVSKEEKATEGVVVKEEVAAAATSKQPSGSAASSSADKKEDDKADDAETAIGLLADPIEKDEDNEDLLDSDDTSVTTPGFLISRFREVFVQLLRMFGLRTASSKRKHRNMDMNRYDDEYSSHENIIEPSNYKEQIRTTVGAVLGRPDCIKRAACRAGSYLRDIKGKDIIIVILEKVTPTKWLETIQMVKDSAIHNEECNYKCLED